MTDLVMGWTTLQVVGFLCVLLFVIVMVRAHLDKRNPIDLTDLLTDYVPGARKHKVSRSGLGWFVGLLVGTWAFVSAAVNHTLAQDWEGIVAFMAVTAGYRAIDTYLKGQRDAAQRETEVPIDDGAKVAKKGILS